MVTAECGRLAEIELEFPGQTLCSDLRPFVIERTAGAVDMAQHQMGVGGAGTGASARLDVDDARPWPVR